MKPIYLIITTFLFAFMLLNSIETMADEFEVKSFTKAENDLAARRYDRMDINGEPCALVKIKTDLNALRFESGIGIAGDVEYKEGQWWVYLVSGERRLSIYKKDFIRLDYDIPLPVESYDVFHMVLTSKRKNVDELPVTFMVEPSDAEIELDGESIENKKPVNLKFGQHQIMIKRDGYTAISKTLKVNKQNVYFEFQMKESEKAAVTINSTPDGAVIIMDGVKIGKTPKSTFYEPGRYPIELRKKGYIPIENEEIEIKEPETTKNYQLQENVGYLKIISHPEATITFNGDKVEPNKSIKLDPSLVNVKAFMPKADTLTETIVIRRKDDKSIEMMPKIKTGTIQVTVTPYDAKIELEGDKGEYFESEGIKKFKNIPIGKYQLKVSKEGFIPYAEGFFLKRDSLIEKEVKLNSKKSVHIISEPSGSDVYLGNRIMGETPLIVKLSPGKHELKLSKAFYNPFIDSVEVDQSMDTIFKKLARNNVKVNIKTKPEDVKLIINDKEIGKTPLDTVMQPGKYKIYFRKPNHVKISRKIKVNKEPISKSYRVKQKGFFSMGYTEGLGSKGGEIMINFGRVIFGIQVTDLPTYNSDITYPKLRDDFFIDRNIEYLSEPFIKVDESGTFDDNMALNGKLGLAIYYPFPLVFYGGYGMRMFTDFHRMYRVQESFNETGQGTLEYEVGDYISTGPRDETIYSPFIGGAIYLRLGYWGGFYGGADYWFEPEEPMIDDQIVLNAGLFLTLN